MSETTLTSEEIDGELERVFGPAQRLLELYISDAGNAAFLIDLAKVIAQAERLLADRIIVRFSAALARHLAGTEERGVVNALGYLVADHIRASMPLPSPRRGEHDPVEDLRIGDAFALQLAGRPKLSSEAALERLRRRWTSLSIASGISPEQARKNADQLAMEVRAKLRRLLAAGASMSGSA